MIIDAILDRMDAIEETGQDSYSMDNAKYIYDCAVIFEFNALANALDNGTNEDVQRELCNYIIDCEYNETLCEFINKERWL